MQKLIEGIVEFRERRLPGYVERFQALSSGQAPEALFITCSDSRVVPDLLASTLPGDLFVMRNVGNLVPPATVEGDSTGDLSEASAIEYATMVLKVGSIIVCGHSGCGAMKAALAGAALPGTPNLAKWLHHSTAAVFRLEHEGPLDATMNPCDQLAQINVLVQLEHLASYPIVRARIADGTLTLSGWWFNIATGDMFIYRRETRKFEIVDRDLAERILRQMNDKSHDAQTNKH